MPFDMGYKNPNAAKAAALKAARAASSPSAEAGAIQKWIAPAEAKERIRIVFDDSGSMTSQISNAKEGVVEFYRNCIPNQTAVAVHPLCSKDTGLEELTSNLIAAASKLKETAFNLGSTPLFRTCMNALALEPKVTRMVLFTDGEPSDTLPEAKLIGSEERWTPNASNLKSADVVIATAKELPCPIDTVYFGSGRDSDAIALLKYIAEGTGGYFLHFDPAKVNFRTAFKYLAPVNRLALASKSVRKEIENGTRN